MMELNPWRRRVSRYFSASSFVRPEIKDHPASPWTRYGVPFWSTRWRWSGPIRRGYGPAAKATLEHTTSVSRKTLRLSIVTSGEHGNSVSCLGSITIPKVNDRNNSPHREVGETRE